MQELEDLRSPDCDHRLAAARALDDLPQTEAIREALRAATTDPDAKVRRAAMHALMCEHCKPDGCIVPEDLDLVIDALLSDASIRNRRWAAGVTMFRQAGSPVALTEAFRTVLATTEDRVLRERAASYLASAEHPRGERPHREWFPVWSARVDELLAS